MDHHCPWIGNCIGFNNHKFFIQMILYGFLNSLYFLVIYRDVIKFLIVSNKLMTISLIFFFGAYIFMIVIILSSFMFLCFNLMIIAKNYTTYEYITKVVRTRNSKQSSDLEIDQSEVQISRYDTGVIYNFSQVFGDNLFLWFIPLNFSSKFHIILGKSVWNNGLNFKVNSKFAFEIIRSV